MVADLSKTTTRVELAGSGGIASLSIRDPKTIRGQAKKATILSRLRALTHHPVQEVKQDSNLFDTDVHVVCIGPTGSGKSSFIANAADVQREIVGHGLGLKTTEVEAFELSPTQLVDTKIILVDTPGFGDKNEDGIVDDVAEWLSERGAGTVYVLYFLPISNTRMGGGTLTWRHFRNLCQFDRVTLVTTMWDKTADAAKGAAREREAMQTYWANMMERGASVKRFQNSPASALAILGPIINEVEETTPGVLRTRLDGRLDELRSTLIKGNNGTSASDLRDIEDKVSDYFRQWEELRRMFRQQVFDGDKRRRLVQDHRRASEDIQSGFDDARKKMRKSGNVFRYLGAILNVERFWGIFSNSKSKRKKGPLVDEDNSNRP